jgi:hypothetical protein
MSEAWLGPELAATLEPVLELAEVLEWLIEDRNTFVIQRIKPAKSCLKNGKGKPPEL